MRHLLHSLRVKALVAVALAGGAVALIAPAASAHVTIEDDQLPAGAPAVLHFDVPNESDKSATTKVEIAIPDTVLIPSVTPRATGDWTVTVETRKLDQPVQTDDGEVSEVVSKVTFEGGKVPVGQFEVFDVAVDAMPDQPGLTLAFPTVQTYDDGTVVRWIDPVKEGQPEPEHPTPIVTLTKAEGEESGSDSSGLAVSGIVLGAIGAVLGTTGLVIALRRRSS